MSSFRLVDRDTGFLLPPSVDEWLPERHLARFVVEVIEGLDLRAMIGSYRGGGEAAYHPRLLLGILVYGYATGVFSRWGGRPPMASMCQDAVVTTRAREPPAMSVSMIGLDIAKSVFQLHGVDALGKVQLKRRLRRDELILYL